MMRSSVYGSLGAMTSALVVAAGLWTTHCAAAERFEGAYYRGEGDVEYLQLLDISRRMFEPDPEFQNMPMLYTPAWNGFVEGPTWGAWWIQNSYGPTYCALPFFLEPSVTFLQNAHDLWFDQMGDGKRAGANNWVAPDGCLCDAASPNWIYYRQGDGRIDIHDWGMEFTAAGILMQAELLLIGRDKQAIERYLPKLRRSADFIEGRRDPKNNLFLAGPAGNLLAPSYAGFKTPDGTYDKAYLAGLSVTYIAALDRLIELEKLAGHADAVKLYTDRRELARKGLPLLTTDEGYFIKSLDPDGARHGVVGAKQYGYFEAVTNHDAICFRVADDAQAEKIYAKIAALPGLRPHDLIITNWPSLDDMYVPPTDWLWKFGTWVNGGHWTTCEARMIMAYYRLGKYEDARRSMRQMMKFARAFRMDNPLVDFGNAVYQPGEPINLCYDNFGAPAALIRGLFEYLYGADGLTLLPHIPPSITRLEQHFPIRFGAKRLYLATAGAGPITGVSINGKAWERFDAKSVSLPYDETPDRAVIQIVLGNATAGTFAPQGPPSALPPEVKVDDSLFGPDRFPVISISQLPLRIGADSNGASRFLGDIARARVFGRALKAKEIAALAEDKPETLSKDPAMIGDWAFDKQADMTFPNAAGAGLPAKIVGNVAVVDSPHGKAVRCAGEGYLEIAPDPRLDLTTSCTLEAWICPKALPSGGARIIDKTTVGGADGYLLDTFPGNSLRMIVERGSLAHDAKLAPGQWAHVAATAEADGTLTLYLNGKRVATEKLAVPLDLAALGAKVARLRKFHAALLGAGLGDSYEASHARLAIECLAVCQNRLRLLADGKLKPLPTARSQSAADKAYFSTAAKLCEGLEKVLQPYEKSANPHRKRVSQLWKTE